MVLPRQPLLPAGTRLTVTRAPETLGLIEETVTTLTSPMVLKDRDLSEVKQFEMFYSKKVATAEKDGFSELDS